MKVVKIGGGREIRHEAIFTDLAERRRAGESFVVVHGANYEMGVISERLGKPPRMVTSVSGYESRYTDRETIEIFKMVYCGKVNKALVELCQRLGIDAVGLSGVDGALLRAERKKALRIVEGTKRRILRDDYSGRIVGVNVELLRHLLDGGYLPLVCPPALSEEFEAVNVDGDRAAAMIAAALSAESLIILSNVPGLLENKDDETTLIREIPRARLSDFEKFAEGRMKKKTMAAAEALDAGVSEVVFADARVDRPLDAALEGRGTRIH